MLLLSREKQLEPRFQLPRPATADGLSRTALFLCHLWPLNLEMDSCWSCRDSERQRTIGRNAWELHLRQMRQYWVENQLWYVDMLANRWLLFSVCFKIWLCLFSCELSVVTVSVSWTTMNRKWRRLSVNMISCTFLPPSCSKIWNVTSVTLLQCLI